MKKLSLLVAFLFISLVSSGQFTVEDYNGVPIVEGDVREFSSLLPTGVSTNESTLNFWINNPSTTDEIYMRIKLESITNADGSSYQFCFGDLCIFDVQEGTIYPISGIPETIPPGGTNLPENKFQNDNPGDGVNYPVDYVWRFFQVDQNGDETGESLTFTYRFDPSLSVADFDNNLGIVLQNTVVTDLLNVQSKSALNFEMFSLNGQLINKGQIEAGINVLNTNGFKAGLYFIRFSDGSNSTTMKFVVK